jgi:ABC-type dipeptide/oligopeptide/nickel transport system permease subunit
MKATIYLLTGLILGAVIGWFMGFLRLPYIETKPSFFMGFFACVAFLLLVLALLFALKKRAFFLPPIGKVPANADSKNARHNYSIIWILVAAFIIVRRISE